MRPLVRSYGRHLDLDLVAGKDADVVLAHATGDVGGDHVAVFKLYAENGVGQGFKHRAFHFNGIVFGHSNSESVEPLGKSAIMPRRRENRQSADCGPEGVEILQFGKRPTWAPETTQYIPRTQLAQTAAEDVASDRSKA
jgi:hypothetical protein